MLFIFAGLGIFFATSSPPPPTPPKGLNAAIIDQLSSIKPNPDFIAEVTQELKSSGLEVDLYQGDEITVDFYRELPKYDYELLIFRAHSGLFLTKKGKVPKKTWLFTNEPYSRTRHIREQLSGSLSKSRVGEGQPFVFAIGPEFIARNMEGQFNNVIVIMMGCSGLYVEDIASAFVQKGASVCLGWDGSVELDYVDKATIELVKNLSNHMSVKEAVEKTMAEIGPDPTFQSRLKYYPEWKGDRTI